jgi:two-component system, cell cycle sensor histidine kinase PleC
MKPARGDAHNLSSTLKLRFKSRKRLGETAAALQRAVGIVDTLQTAESRARLALETLPAAVAYFDADGRRRFSNAVWEIWLGDPLFIVSAVAAALSSAVGDADSRFETDIACADGQTRHILFQCRAQPGGGACVVGLDISEQHAAKLALRDREEMHSLAMRGPNEGLWDWNPITKELYLSARLLAILGFDGDTLRTTSHEWLKLVHADDRRRYEHAVSEHLKGLSQHFECEYRVRDRNGQYRWMLARGLAQRRADGRCYRMVGSIGDITDIKRREQAARANEARFRALVSVSGAIFLVVDGKGVIQEANREAERALAGRQREIVGLAWRDLMDPDCAGAFAEQLKIAGAGAVVRGFEQTLRADTPDRCVLLWNIDRFDMWEDGTGQTLLICAGQDITLRKQAENALIDANEALERKVAERTGALIEAKNQAEVANRAKSEFLANMSHELRTPLNAIIGFADMTQGEMVGPINNKKYVEYAQVISSSAHHLLGVISDVLDFAKIEAGRFRIEQEAVNLIDIADSCLTFVAEKARSGEIVLVADYAPDLPKAWGDALRIKQILLNLLSNALKFTAAGKEVRLSLKPEGADHVRIVVADQGCGMTAAELAIAMEPFGQVDNKLTRRAGGTGLGLPLSKRFVEMHGGRFEITGAPGVGVTVSAVFPRAPAFTEE